MVLPEGVRLIGVGIYHLTGEHGRQMRFEDLLPETQTSREAETARRLEALRGRYGLDFAGNLDKIFRGETLYRTIEYMRTHRGGAR